MAHGPHIDDLIREAFEPRPEELFEIIARMNADLAKLFVLALVYPALMVAAAGACFALGVR